MRTTHERPDPEGPDLSKPYSVLRNNNTLTRKNVLSRKLTHLAPHLRRTQLRVMNGESA